MYRKRISKYKKKSNFSYSNKSTKSLLNRTFTFTSTMGIHTKPNNSVTNNIKPNLTNFDLCAMLNLCPEFVNTAKNYKSCKITRCRLVVHNFISNN